MANTTATLYIRSRTGYRKPLKKLTDLPEGEHYQLFWYEGSRKKSKDVGRFKDAALVAQLNKQTELAKAAITGALEPAPARPEPEYVKDAVKKYLEEVHDRVGNSGYGASRGTEYAYRKRLDYLLEFDGVTPMHEVNEEYFKRYRRFLRTRLKSDRYIYNCVQSANIFFHSRGNESCKKILKETGFEPKVVKAYSAEELNRFFLHCGSSEELLYKFFLHSMARKREVAYTENGDLLFDESVFWIQPKPHRQFRLKGKRSGQAVYGRKVPMPRSFMATLKQYCEGKKPGDLLFPNENGGPDNHHLKKCKRIAKAAGLNQDEWALHRFRKTGATMHYKAGVPVPTISAWLGHEDLLVTKMYLDIREVADPAMVDVVSKGALVAWV
jgi:integrase